jgi:hypothetical protein
MLDHDQTRAMADKAREIATPVIEKLGISWQQQEQQAAQPK